MRVILPAALILAVMPTIAHAADTNLWSEFIFYVQTQQQAFHRELATTLRALQTGGTAALIAMITVSFMYGVFHAAGPGHGKAVIGTYLLTQKSALKRGITLSVLASLLQGLMAIFLVEGVVLIIGVSSRDALNTVPYLEKASFTLVGLIGLYLIRRAVKLYQTPAPHDHSHDHDHAGHGDTCDTCGHAHGPTAEELSKSASLRDHLAIIVSIGIRPCSGSVLVLVFAEVLGLRLAGILSVLMISIGTAITVSSLAILAVYFQKAARAIANEASGNTLRKMAAAATLAGGLFITFLSISLLLEPMNSGNPLF